MERADSGQTVILKDGVIVSKAGVVNDLTSLLIAAERPGDECDAELRVKNAERYGCVCSDIGRAVDYHFDALAGVAARELVIGVNFDLNSAVGCFLDEFFEVICYAAVNLSIGAVDCHSEGDLVVCCGVAAVVAAVPTGAKCEHHRQCENHCQYFFHFCFSFHLLYFSFFTFILIVPNSIQSLLLFHHHQQFLYKS